MSRQVMVMRRSLRLFSTPFQIYNWAECRAEGTVFPSPDGGLAWRVIAFGSRAQQQVFHRLRLQTGTLLLRV